MRLDYQDAYDALSVAYDAMRDGAKDIQTVRAEQKRERLDAIRVRGGQIRTTIARVPDDGIGEATKSDISHYIKTVKDLVRQDYPDRLTHWRATDKATTLREALNAQIEFLDELAQ